MAVLKESEPKRLSGRRGVGSKEKEMHPFSQVPWVLAADNAKDEGGRMKDEDPILFPELVRDIDPDGERRRGISSLSFRLHPY